MSREREIFEQALAQPTPEARAAFVEQAAAGDPQLREAVESLLANHRADTFLEPDTVVLQHRNLARAEAERTGEEQIGDCIGRYRLLEQIGEGGFGVVYRAEQGEPVRRQVALKVIRLGMDTKSVVARFEAERQALALMDHPGIARVLDGGATPAGRPYFVMELVRGVRITEYCEANRTPLRERLGLFIKLCHAVQHAHQKGVIHRDLKPSNVLVTVVDGRPIPKVIDFGIAKAIAEPLTPKTLLTEFHAFLGTPAYTSPEQAEITGANVDTRSDIYSLGVLLYELLTGVTPFDAEELMQSGLDAMRRTIKEVEPPTPSTRTRRAVAGRPAPQAGLLIDRDLDWIVMKCLEKDRSRRYPTAQDLASDLERYLNHEPVLARPQSAAYRLRKAVHRHRAAFATAAAILLVTVLGAAVSVRQAVRATKAEKAANEGRLREAALRQGAEQERERAIAARARAELNEYVADINLAHQSILAGNLARARELLGRHRSEGLGRFEWRHLWNAARGADHQVVATEPSSILSLAASPDFLVVGLRDAVNIYAATAGGLVKTLAKPGNSVALSGHGLLATAGRGSVRLWRTSDWTEVHAFNSHSAPVAFSGDGRWLALQAAEGVRVVDTATGNPVGSIPDSTAPFAFSPAGDLLAVDTREGILLWDVPSRRARRRLEDSRGVFHHMGAWMRDRKALAFAPDGRSVIAARNPLTDERVFFLDVWSTDSGERLATLPAQPNAVEHTGTIAELAFAPGGSWLASAGWDHSLRLWDFAARRPVRTLHGSPAELWAVAFAPDGGAVFTGGKDGAVRRWPTHPAPRDRLIGDGGTPLRFSRNGEILAVLDGDSRLAALNLKTGEPEFQLQLGTALPGLTLPAITADLRTVIEPLAAGFRLWDCSTMQSNDVAHPDGMKSWVAVAPGGESFLAAGRLASLLWWNRRELSEPPMRVAGQAALFSEDGGVLVTLGDRAFQRWNARSRAVEVEFPLPFAYSPYIPFALSGDGAVLAVGSDPVNDSENAIHLWDTRTGRLLGICRGHTQGVRWLAFAPGGETLASVSDDSTLRFWNVRTQQELLSIRQLANPPRDIRFSPDGQWLAVKTLKGLRLLDGSQTASAQEINSAANQGYSP